MIYYIYGTDAYLCGQKADELKKGFIEKKDKGGLNVIHLDYSNLSFDLFSQEALTVPFLSEKKMLLISGLCTDQSAATKKMRAEILDFLLKHENLDNNLLFIDVFADEKKIPIKDGLFKFLSSQKYSWMCSALKNRDLSDWIAKYCAQNKIVIKPTAVSELVILVGNDLVQLVNELDKLRAYKNEEPVEAKDVRLLVRAKYDSDTFKLTDALANKNRAEAIRLISAELAAGNEPLSLLGSINWQFKTLSKIKSAQAESQRPTAAIIAEQTGLHPFVVSKNLSAVNKFPPQELTAILNELLEMDRQFKTGHKNPELMFDMFIAKHC